MFLGQEIFQGGEAGDAAFCFVYLSHLLKLVLGGKYWGRERSEVGKPGWLIFFVWGVVDEGLGRGESAGDKVDISELTSFPSFRSYTRKSIQKAFFCKISLLFWRSIMSQAW